MKWYTSIWGPPVEQVPEPLLALVRFEAVVLLHGHPRQIPPLPARSRRRACVCSFSRWGSSSRAASHSSRVPISVVRHGPLPSAVTTFRRSYVLDTVPAQGNGRLPRPPISGPPAVSTGSTGGTRGRHQAMERPVMRGWGCEHRAGRVGQGRRRGGLPRAGRALPGGPCTPIATGSWARSRTPRTRSRRRCSRPGEGLAGFQERASLRTWLYSARHQPRA